MRLMRHPLAAFVLAAWLLAAGCSSTRLDGGEPPVESRTPVPVESTPPAPGGAAGATSTPQSQVATVDLNKPQSPSTTPATGLLAQRVVYFDFDSFVIKDEFRPMLEAHAKALAANRGKRMVLEGHADERGGREYNLALGQKRAEAVLKSMVLLGAADAQLEAVSFGEERPADPGRDEAAWAKNRRVELKDR